MGEPLPEVSRDVAPEPMKAMAAILRDPNMIHLDPGETARPGMGDRTVKQGPLNLGYVQTMLAGYAGGVDRIRATGFRFLGPVYAGDRVVAGGVVTGHAAAGQGASERAGPHGRAGGHGRAALELGPPAQRRFHRGAHRGVPQRSGRWLALRQRLVEALPPS